MLHAHDSMFREPELLPIEVLHCGNGDFDLCCCCDVDLEQRSSYTNSTRMPSRYTGCVNMNINAFESYRLTDIHTDTQERNYVAYHATSLM